jgi:putative hemolysin
MKDMPVPTLPLANIELPRGSLHRGDAALVVPDASQSKPEKRQLSVSWAKNLTDIRQAQRLRYRVFAGEMGANLPVTLEGHDIDDFDPYCEHLLVRDALSAEVIGTYRLLTPVQAKLLGTTYTDQEFDLSAIDVYRDRMVELGRSCVHPDYRDGAVIMALWGALADFMVRNELDVMIGCASIPMLHHGVVSGELAASVWHQLKDKYLASPDQRVTPHLPLPMHQWATDLQVEPPALIKGYLRLGAKILGEPAWDPDFNTADLPMLMRLTDMPTRYRKHFLGM